MAPPSPKRPSRQRGAGQAPAKKKPDVELPFDDVEDLTPLRADDPQPQRVAQYPSGVPRRRRGGGGDAVMPGGAGPEAELEDGFQPAFLYVERGPGMGQLSPIRQGVTLIGRASTAGLRLQHPSISRKHAEVARRAERFFIKDFGSQNGTYVNGVRIEKETELFAGDEIVVGTAQLRLRAQGAQTGGQTGQRVDSGRSSAEKSSARKSGSSVVFVAIAAGVVGSALATVGIFVYFKVSRGPSFEELPGHTPPPISASTTAGPPPGATPPATPTATPPPGPANTATATPPPSANPMVAAPLTPPGTSPSLPGLPTPPSPPPTIQVGEPPAPLPPSTASSPGTRSDPITDLSLSSSIPDRQKRPQKRPDRLSSTAPPSKADLEDPPRDNPAAAPPADPTVMARYENGDVGAAIELAKKKGEKELAAKLARFQTQYDAGMRALSSQDEGAALRNLDAALKMDEQFSGGWGKYNAELRRTLSSIYTMSGKRMVDAGNTAGAWKAFTSALQYDPDNGPAKTELSKLPTSSAPPPAPKQPASRRADIDAAFGK